MATRAKGARMPSGPGPRRPRDRYMRGEAPAGGFFAPQALIPSTRTSICFSVREPPCSSEKPTIAVPATPVAMIERKVSRGNNGKIRGIVQGDGPGGLTLVRHGSRGSSPRRASSKSTTACGDCHACARVGFPGIQSHAGSKTAKAIANSHRTGSNFECRRKLASGLTLSPPFRVALQRQASRRATSSVAFPPLRT